MFYWYDMETDPALAHSVHFHKQFQLSICIPCWEFNGKGLQYLSRLINSIRRQNVNLKDLGITWWEIVINDQSKDDEIRRVTSWWMDDVSLPIRYVRDNNQVRSNSTGINGAIDNATCHIIKPMFQDDLFYDDYSLNAILTEFLHPRADRIANGMWAACSNVHWYNDVEVPVDKHWPEIKGDGIKDMALGCPSNIIFVKECGERFDPNLIWYMDCEFYWRMYRRFGEPLYVNRTRQCIVNCVSKYRISADKARMAELAKSEEEYLKKKYADHPEFKM